MGGTGGPGPIASAATHRGLTGDPGDEEAAAKARAELDAEELRALEAATVIPVHDTLAAGDHPRRSLLDRLLGRR
jgi:hypothetical protein